MEMRSKDTQEISYMFAGNMSQSLLLWQEIDLDYQLKIN